jgi:hypothetical protein
MELMLRSLFAKHSSDLDLSVTVYDNDSQDDMTDLRAYAESRRIPVIQSGFTTETKNNSHGEVLSRFVLEHPDCTHYLFLDADVCFVEDNTLDVMLAELERRSDAFGIGPRMSWDGAVEIPEEIRKGNPDLYEARLHPCCALVKNTEVFRRVVREIGLSCAKLCWADGEEYLDTFKLMTKVMKTHGLRHIISSKMVMHFFCVSYDWEPTQHLVGVKARRRDALLREFRERDGGS